jgi:hypothetical protein
MQPKTDSMRKLLLWGALVVLAHFVVVLWHLVLLVKVQPSIPTLAILLLILINLVSVAGLVAFAKGFRKLAGSMIVIPLGVALVIGGYTHFLSAGTDNVLRLPPGDLRLPFQVSAVLLMLLEGAGCWIAVRMFA